MTIYCSNRPNDQDMIKALGSLALPLPLLVDCAFSGVGDNDQSLAVAVERKKIGDLCQCILDGRYLNQVQSAKRAGFDVLCLIVEGDVRSNPDDGILEVPVWGINPRTLHRCQIWEPVKPTITYSRFDQYLTELDYLAGVIVKRSANVKETAVIIKALWDNFQTPPSKHNSLHKIYEQPVGQVLLVKPSLVRRVAKEMEGIGWERSRVVAERFPTVKAMVEADVKEWLGIEGVGKKTAEKVVKALRGGNR